MTEFKNGDKCRCPEIFRDEVLTYIGKAPGLAFSNDCVVLREGDAVPVRESCLVPCFPVPEDFEKRMHWYLVSYRVMGQFNETVMGHTHFKSKKPIEPPKSTIDIMNRIGAFHDVSPERIVITSIFYFGHVVSNNESNNQEV